MIALVLRVIERGDVDNGDDAVVAKKVDCIVSMAIVELLDSSCLPPNVCESVKLLELAATSLLEN